MEGEQKPLEALEALVPRRVVVVLGVRLHSEAAELLVVPVSAAQGLPADLREVLASATYIRIARGMQ